jgi:hypothetical protein
VRHQEVIFNLAGQSFFYDVPEGRPAASPVPTVQVFLATNDDDGVAETATTGACSIDSVDTTLSSAAAAGDTQVTVASAPVTTRGRRYLITDASGDRELVEIRAVSGTTVGLRRPLSNSYASGAAFQGTRITIGVNATWVADRSKITDALGSNWRTDVEDDPAQFAGHPGYRLRWSYTAGGVAMIGVNFADLVRYAAKNLITPLDVDARFAGWIDRLPPDYQRDQGAALVDEAFHAVREDLLGDAQTARKIRSTDVVGTLTIYKAALLAAQHNVLAGRTEAAAVGVAQDLYTQRYNQLARTPKFPVDSAGSGASAQPQRLPVWRR